MKPDRPARKSARKHCAEIYEDDGLNPRDDPKDGGRNRWQGRKCTQLCRQVAETLDLVFTGDCRDELLQSLRVVAVAPAPFSSRLLVTVVADLPAAEADPQEILDRLQKHAGRLRSEVAASIHRRKTPTLVFRLSGGAVESDSQT